LLKTSPTGNAAAGRRHFITHRLPNGLTLLGQYMPDVASAACCFYVETGARDEAECHAGVRVEPLESVGRGEAGVTEIRAALGILEQSIKAVEVLDLAQQIQDLQRQIEETKHEHSGASSPGEPAASDPGAGRGQSVRSRHRRT